jgi:hypothetical protein
MKTRLVITAAAVTAPLLLLNVVAAATAPAGNTAAVPLVTAEFVSPDAPEAAEIRILGDRAINRLAYSLVTEAAHAVSKQGEMGALGVCHLKSVSATGAVIPDMPRVTAWKRTSLRLRDPANAPDTADVLALNRMESELRAGNVPPKLLVQRVEQSDGTPEWRVYKPVAVLKQCVGCHGRDEIPADVRAELSRRYPLDQATGYAQGEWRGLVRVTVAAASAAVAPPAPAAGPAKPVAAPAKAPAKTRR